jgi:hypothetical protein
MDIRSYYNSFKQQDFVDGIRDAGNQYGYVNSRNDYFAMKSTSQTAIVFDIDTSTTTLLPQVKRAAGVSTSGKEHSVTTKAIALAYFKHSDTLTVEDIQGHRAPQSTDNETLARATAEKLQDMRRAWDMTNEYLKIQALKGLAKSPDGVTIFDAFTEFGVSQTTVDFLLGTSTTNVDGKIATLKRGIGTNVKTGGAISGIEVLVDPTFFDKLVNHPSIVNAYVQYMNSGKQQMRDDLSSYMQWGIMDVFEHRGVRFISYDATFNLPDGTTEAAIASSAGHAYALGVQGLFRGYNGPSAKLSGANQAGQELYVRTYVDPKDEYVEFELEAAPLYFCSKPASLYKVTSSN